MMMALIEKTAATINEQKKACLLNLRPTYECRVFL